MSNNIVYGPVEVYRFTKKSFELFESVDIILHNSALAIVCVHTTVYNPDNPDKRKIDRSISEPMIYSTLRNMKRSYSGRITDLIWREFEQVSIPDPYNSKALFSGPDVVDELTENDDDPLYLDLG